VLRIVSGKYKGRKIFPPKNLPVRPTTDFAKESLFNILNNYFDFETVKFLDLFSGTGNMTYECSSRGCSDIVCVDADYGCCRFIKETVAALEMPNVRVIKNDAFRFLNKVEDSFDIIFADPPFTADKKQMIPELVFSRKLLKENGWLVVEHPKEDDFSGHERFREKRNYGNINFSIFG
jgi:16S rRNA (guanine966-N2)-methyltransferase